MMGLFICIFGQISVVIFNIVDYNTEKHDKKLFKDLKEDSTQTQEEEEAFKLSDMKNLSLKYWLTSASMNFIYIATIDSITIGSKQLQDRYGFDSEQAGYLTTIPYLIAGISSLPLGWFVEKFGYKDATALIGSIFIIGGHLLSLFMPECNQCSLSVVPMILYGLAYSTYAVVLWGNIAFFVEEKFLGTAYGILTVITNTGTALVPPLLGFIKENTEDYGQGYMFVEVFFIACSVIQLLLNLWVQVLAKREKK